MIFKHNGEYYILVSDTRLVKVDAKLSNGGVRLAPTKSEIRFAKSSDINNYKKITTAEIIKELSAPVKEVSKDKDEFESRIIKPKNKN